MMATTKARAQVPFYFSSSGSNDEARIQHNGTDLEIDNDTGKTKIGNKTNYHLTIDHSTGNIGIGTINPLYTLEMERTGTSVQQFMCRTDGSTLILAAAQTVVNVGSYSNHTLRLYVNSDWKMRINTDGSVEIPDAYTRVIGGTNVDLYVDSTGLLGPLPSSQRFKENIRDITEIPELYQLRIRKADLKSGEKDIICLIAEEAEDIMSSLVRYAIYEKTETEDIQIDCTNYTDMSNSKKLTPNVPKRIYLKRKKRDVAGNVIIENGEEVEEEIEKECILKPQSINKSDLIIPLLLELQNMKKEIDLIKSGDIANFIDSTSLKPKEKKSMKKKLGIK
jgi:hypothetical protein